jgi:hypothetical protein
MRLESKSVEDAARWNSQHLPEKKAETETHSESPINHAKAYVFSEIKMISQEIYLVKSVEDAALWNNQHLDEE